MRGSVLTVSLVAKQHSGQRLGGSMDRIVVVMCQFYWSKTLWNGQTFLYIEIKLCQNESVHRENIVVGCWL